MGKPVPVVIIARNSLALTKLTVKSALAQDVPVTVLVLDNYSGDGTREWLRSKRGIVPCFASEQWSLAACWNWMLRALWKDGAERALVLNNDVVIAPETVRLLCAYMDGHDATGEIRSAPFVTCVSVNDESQVKVDALSWSYHVRPHPDFSCFMISKECTDKVGWFDEEMFPAYCEDSDYHVRMHRAGVRAVCLDIPFLHHGSSTIKNAAPGEQAKIRRGADANRERFRQKYGCLPGTPDYEALFS